jgi:hypothetical protein
MTSNSRLLRDIPSSRSKCGREGVARPASRHRRTNGWRRSSGSPRSGRRRRQAARKRCWGISASGSALREGPGGFDLTSACASSRMDFQYSAGKSSSGANKRLGMAFPPTAAANFSICLLLGMRQQAGRSVRPSPSCPAETPASKLARARAFGRDGRFRRSAPPPGAAAAGPGGPSRAPVAGGSQKTNP